MSSFSERNDPNRKASKKIASNKQSRQKKSFSKASEPDRKPYSPHGVPSKPPAMHRDSKKSSLIDCLWGVHAVEAALNNPDRTGYKRLYATEARLETLEAKGLLQNTTKITICLNDALNQYVPSGAVHQGIVLQTEALEGVSLEALTDLSLSGRSVIIVLDQVTDVQNIGAIFRSCLAFGATGIVFHDRHTPPIQGALAKAAAGSIESLPFVRATNLSRALEKLSQAGFISYGLDGEATIGLHQALDADKPDRLVLVLGSEGDGMRRLVREHCDQLVKIPMPGGFESLNVSHAASLALYESLVRNLI